VEASPSHGKFQGGGTAWRTVFREVPISAAFSTWFGTGFLPFVPGTWGSLAAIPLAEILFRLAGLRGLGLFAVLVSAGGILAAHRTARVRRIGDPSEIVIDEVAGQSIALFAVYATCPLDRATVGFWGVVFLSFVVFRILDIWKPGPIGWLERLPGGFGIMADDLLAGLLEAIVFAGVLKAM
jgi:phosphatidylglycerophosphatase A